jgi:Transposase DDE domain
MEDNPFMKHLYSQKGFPGMHDTALTQVQTNTCTPHLTASSPSLAQHIVTFLELVLVQAPHECTEMATAGKRPRGAPAKLPMQQLWLGMLAGTIRQAKHMSSIWRNLCLENTGTFPAVHLTYEAIRKRLLSAGTQPLQQLFASLSVALASWALAQQPSALGVAGFATQVVALDETTLDAVRRLTQELRDLPKGDPHVLVGKLAGLFDLRLQRWVRMQFRADVLAGCNIGVLTLLAGLPTGSLILADLGYFSFPWFDYLTEQGYFWVSRLKERTTYQIKEVLAYDDRQGLLDAIVWLGKYRADRAGNAVRLVICSSGDRQYGYLTNVLDPTQLSMQDIAQLYARRWDIELAFKLLKCELGLQIWWAARPELVMIQLWIALILAQILHALQLHVAMQAEVEPFDISLHVMVDLLGSMPAGPTPVLDRLIEQGRFLGLIRPSTRMRIVVPELEPHMICPVPVLKDLTRQARYAQRNGHPRTVPFVSRFLTQLLI